MARLVDVMMLVTLDLLTRTSCVKKVGGFAGARLSGLNSCPRLNNLNIYILICCLLLLI